MSTLVFAYNADRGLISALTDAAHRLLAPETYQCRLTMIAGSVLGPRRRWKKFVSSLDSPVEFVHRDELKNSHAIDDIPLPAVFVRHNGRLHLAVAADAINRCQTIDELAELVRSIMHDC